MLSKLLSEIFGKHKKHIEIKQCLNDSELRQGAQYLNRKNNVVSDIGRTSILMEAFTPDKELWNKGASGGSLEDLAKKEMEELTSLEQEFSTNLDIYMSLSKSIFTDEDVVIKNYSKWKKPSINCIPKIYWTDDLDDVFKTVDTKYYDENGQKTCRELCKLFDKDCKGYKFEQVYHFNSEKTYGKCRLHANVSNVKEYCEPREGHYTLGELKDKDGNWKKPPSNCSPQLRYITMDPYKISMYDESTSNYSVTNDNQENCRKKCEKDTNCKMYLYYYDTYRDDDNCYLYSEATNGKEYCLPGTTNGDYHNYRGQIKNKTLENIIDGTDVSKKQSLTAINDTLMNIADKIYVKIGLAEKTIDALRSQKGFERGYLDDQLIRFKKLFEKYNRIKDKEDTLDLMVKDAKMTGDSDYVKYIMYAVGTILLLLAVRRMTSSR